MLRVKTSEHGPLAFAEVEEGRLNCGETNR